MKKISDRISLYQSAFWQLNSTLIHHLETTIVWDPAYSDSEIKSICDEANTFKGSSRYLIYTHGDFDHIAGDPHFKDFKKVGSSRMKERTDHDKILDQIHETDHEFYLDRSFDIKFPVLDLPLDLHHPFTISLGKLEIICYRAGGHTSDGLFTVVPSLNLLVAGDYLSDIEFPFIEDSIEEYYKTLDRAESLLKDHHIKFMVPGHGQPANSINQIIDRIVQSRKYLDSLRISEEISDWRKSWGESPFNRYLDKAHQKNISYVRSQRI